jgi:hypothetical protein
MLKHPLPGVSRRLSGVGLTAVLIASGSYVAWAAQPEPKNAREQQQEASQIAISADRVSTLENGDIEYSGNVIITKSSDREHRVRLTPGTIEHRPDGSTVLEGAVRILFAGRVLKTDRAIFGKDGTIRMDSARESQTSESL